jgi:hypothetical protein
MYKMSMHWKQNGLQWLCQCVCGAIMPTVRCLSIPDMLHRGVHWSAPSNGLRLTGFDHDKDWFISYEYDAGEGLFRESIVNHMLHVVARQKNM